MSHKYDVWFCSCGRIHFHPIDDLDWMSEDHENRRVLEVCRNCGHIHEQFLTESFYGDGDKRAFDVDGDDYFNDENVLIMENTNYRIYIRKGIKVPIKKGGYADYHFSDGYCNFEQIQKKFGHTYLPTVKEKDPDYVTVDTDRLIKEIQRDYPEEADDLLKSISGYVAGISWKGTPYEHKWTKGGIIMYNSAKDVTTAVLADGYNFKGTMNCDLTFKFDYNAGTIELYSSYGELIGNAYSISSLIELLTKLRNDELA